MRNLPPFVSPRLARRQRNSNQHPDADLLAAFAQENVSRGERAAILSHLADCPHCREVLALASTGNQAATIADNVLSWWGWRLAATAAALFIVIAAVWQLPSAMNSPPIEKPSMSQHMAASTHEPSVTALPPAAALDREAPKSRKTVIHAQQISPRQRSTQVTVRAATPLPTRGMSQSNASIIISEQHAPLNPGAPPPSPAFTAGALRNPAIGPNSMFSSPNDVARMKAFMRVPYQNSQTVWTLETVPGNGSISKSDDGGKTWRTVPIDGVTPFYALSVLGSNVWVGGANGKLFHSVDNGVSWIPITVTYEDTTLNDRIVQISPDGESITLKTAAGLTLKTTDAGQHWEHQ